MDGTEQSLLPMCISDSEVPLHILFTDDGALYHFVVIPMIIIMIMIMIIILMHQRSQY